MIIARVLAAVATAAGIAAWVAYQQADLILSHYDARAHLVVSRRIIDNITPGWQQIGAVWLPLPHIINATFAQIDFLYRTGVFASAISIACLAISVYAAVRLVLAITGSAPGAVLAGVLLILNPNLLYLHVTPMTEPLLLTLLFLTLWWLFEWVRRNEDGVPWRLGGVLAAAVLTRYEAWPVVVAAIGAAIYASSRLGATPHISIRRALRLAVWPASAIAIALLNSRITVGEWFSSSFFVPDPEYQGQAGRSLIAVWWGTHRLSTPVTEAVALVAAAIFSIRAVTRRSDATLLLPVALLAAAALPAIAFYEGHPFRIRYMVTMTAACALFCGCAAGMLRRNPSMIMAGMLAGVTLVQSPPWKGDAPVVLEAQWDRAAAEGRHQVTTCLVRAYDDRKILASMGSLAHYMQDLSADGFDLSDFVHEGNGVIWDLALETGPAPHAGWMLVEEQAEGGDVLAQRIRRDPSFARGMRRLCEGGGVALYAGH